MERILEAFRRRYDLSSPVSTGLASLLDFPAAITEHRRLLEADLGTVEAMRRDCERILSDLAKATEGIMAVAKDHHKTAVRASDLPASVSPACTAEECRTQVKKMLVSMKLEKDTIQVLVERYERTSITRR